MIVSLEPNKKIFPRGGGNRSRLGVGVPEVDKGGGYRNFFINFLSPLDPILQGVFNNESSFIIH